MCALDELGHLNAPVDNTTEQIIYSSTQRAPQAESSPAKVVKTAQGIGGAQAWILEAPFRTGVLMANAPRQLVPAWAEYTAELWSNWVWRTPRALSAADLGQGVRAMLISVIVASGLTHFVLARQDAGQYWVMNPDGGTDQQDANLFDYINNFSIHQYGAVNYLYTGICVCVS
jgi:hypothetical protein